MKTYMLITIIIATLAVMTLVIFNYVMQPRVLPSTEYFKAFRESRNVNQEPADPEVASTTPSVPGDTNTQPESQAVVAARVYAARIHGFNAQDFELLEVTEKAWPDSCLGLAKPEEMCAQVIMPGYEIRLQLKGNVYVYRANESGTVIREQSSGIVTLPEPPKTGQTTVTKLHSSCRLDSDCDPGVPCLGYYGIAGSQGPQFASCEIRCASDSECPSGLTCGTIADGPGRVCY